MRGAVAIFARAPVAGEAKRRLIPALGPDGAAELQRRMTSRAVAAAVEARIGSVELWCTPDRAHPSFRALAVRYPISLRVQQGRDLGERMAGAMRTGLARHPFVLLMGSDCPALDADSLRRSARWLADGLDAVLVPAVDGGYVLVGLQRFEARLFVDIAWGTERVLEETRCRLCAMGWGWRETEPFADIDRPSDLAHLRSEMICDLFYIN